MRIPLITSGEPVAHDKFWDAIQLYHNRPQIVNRKLIGVSQLYFHRLKVNADSIKIWELLSYTSILYEVRKLEELTNSTLSNLIKDLINPYYKDLELIEANFDECKTAEEGLFISLRLLLHKQTRDKSVEIVLLDRKHNVVSFISVRENSNEVSPSIIPFHLECTTNGEVRLLVDQIDDAEKPSADWLVDKLFSKIIKWAEESAPVGPVLPSLSLVSMEKYSALYHRLKEQQGKKMVEIWPENTDPLKFVYEEIAIAAYLMCLWDTLSPGVKPSFVDLGCGNGFLVYLLSQEGYQGYGIDVRKRKIWDLYPCGVKLEVKTITPSAKNLFPEVDWIIGNHSDELTPWIPVLTARSAYKTNFFLLPCCTYDFSGKKYSRTDTSKSQYNAYLDYVQNISVKCGFILERDKLRIPSTKKVCIVSKGRNYGPEKYEEVDAGITKFIQERCGTTTMDLSKEGIPFDQSELWTDNFKPRVAVEKVRNCTKLERNLIDKLVKKVVEVLLEEPQYLDKISGGKWNAGKQMKLQELIKRLDGLDLKKLKSECGGMQTLLRNHRYIFEVVKGTVKLRLPLTLDRESKFKGKLCWFLRNHPDGCLHDASSCAYSHDL